MSNRIRRPIPGAAHVAGLLALFCLVALTALTAAAEEEPFARSLRLSNEHVGMLKKQLEPPSMRESAEAEVVVDAAEMSNAFVDEAPAPTAEPEAGSVLIRRVSDIAPVPTPTPAPRAGASAASLGFEQCMERSIRAGNAYEETMRVCRAVTGEADANADAAGKGPNW